MSWNETIDNHLYDEENEYTQASDLWDELIALFAGEHKVDTLLQSALERLRYSDEILAIYKYLHKCFAPV